MNDSNQFSWQNFWFISVFLEANYSHGLVTDKILDSDCSQGHKWAVVEANGKLLIFSQNAFSRIRPFTSSVIQWSPFQFQMYRSNNHFHRSQPQRSWEEPRRRWTELGSSFFVVFSALVVAMLTWTGLWVFKSGSQIYSEQRRVQPGSEVDFSISPLWPLCFWVTLFHLGDFVVKWILKHQAPRFSF